VAKAAGCPLRPVAASRDHEPQRASYQPVAAGGWWPLGAGGRWGLVAAGGWWPLGAGGPCVQLAAL